MHKDLIAAKELIYDRCGLNLSKLQLSEQSGDYGACSFQLDGKAIEFRISKITPQKTGQFVAIWKRNKEGITEPFAMSDELDFIIVAARAGDNVGLFIFPKFVLCDKGIISRDGKCGKRGIRIYPPWNMVTNKQAEKTQQWQNRYFMSISGEDLATLSLTKQLLA